MVVLGQRPSQEGQGQESDEEDDSYIPAEALSDWSWEVLVPRSCKILSSSSGLFMTLLWDSLRGPGMKILVKVLYDSLSEDLVVILLKSFKRSLHDLVEVLVKRSCGDPVEILLWRSLRQDLDSALHWCLYESSSGILIGNSWMMIWWSCKVLLKVLLWWSFEFLFDVLVWSSVMRCWSRKLAVASWSYSCFSKGRGRPESNTVISHSNPPSSRGILKQSRKQMVTGSNPARAVRL